jgi:hypothetical protein
VLRRTQIGSFQDVRIGRSEGTGEAPRWVLRHIGPRVLRVPALEAASKPQERAEIPRVRVATHDRISNAYGLPSHRVALFSARFAHDGWKCSTRSTSRGWDLGTRYSLTPALRSPVILALSTRPVAAPSPRLGIGARPINASSLMGNLRPLSRVSGVPPRKGGGGSQTISRDVGLNISNIDPPDFQNFQFSNIRISP